MESSNYLPYAIDKEFQRVNQRRGYSKYANFMQRYAHRRERQAIREFLRSKREREPSKYKWWVTGWDID